MMEINVELHQWSINILIKKTSGSNIKSENISNKELHKKNIIKLKKKKKSTLSFYTQYLRC